MALLSRLLLAAALTVSTAVTAQTSAATRQPTRLERIAATNQIVIGYQEAAPPFAYLDGDRRPIGYAVEISRAVAEAVRLRLGRPQLALRYNAVTPVTRIPLVVNNVVDVVCGTAANRIERQQRVEFSTTIFISEVRIGVADVSPIRGVPDLQGKRVSLVGASTTEERVNALAAERKLDMKVIPARNNLRAFQALARGESDAFVAAEAWLAGEFARSEKASGFRIVGEPLEREAFGCLLPRNEPEFKRLVDETIGAMMASGEMARLYDKWFIAPIPPENRAIGLPLSAAMKALFAAPNDTPLE